MHSLALPNIHILVKTEDIASPTHHYHIFTVLTFASRQSDGHSVYHLSIIWFHERIAKYSFDEAFVGSGMAPRLQLHFFDHGISEAVAPLFTRVGRRNTFDCLFRDQKWIRTDVI